MLGAQCLFDESQEDRDDNARLKTFSETDEVNWSRTSIDDDDDNDDGK